MKHQHSHTPATRRGPGRDLILGVASAAPSGFFLGSAVYQSAPGFGALILLISLIAGLGVWTYRRRTSAPAEEPILTHDEVEAELSAAPAPPTSI